MKNETTTWSRLNAGKQKRMKHSPAEFCMHVRFLLDSGLISELRAALTSALTSQPCNAVPIAEILRHLGWRMGALAATTNRAGIPVAQIERACTDALASDLVGAMRRGIDEDNRPFLRSKRREDRHPFVLTNQFINEVAHSGAA